MTAHSNEGMVAILFYQLHILKDYQGQSIVSHPLHLYTAKELLHPYI